MLIFSGATRMPMSEVLALLPAEFSASLDAGRLRGTPFTPTLVHVPVCTERPMEDSMERSNSKASHKAKNLFFGSRSRALPPYIPYIVAPPHATNAADVGARAVLSSRTDASLHALSGLQVYTSTVTA